MRMHQALNELFDLLDKATSHLVSKCQFILKRWKRKLMILFQEPLCLSYQMRCVILPCFKFLKMRSATSVTPYLPFPPPPPLLPTLGAFLKSLLN